ncbi:hypothetical protein HS088_TW18G00280 [Tripterygium wilfordii]|uniref:Pentatricopeptide repeat-containing protein n=1 Tax=Tripterygium wilfordii TaxID=458696 RepID=A0A7J7CBU9_TRIWF|nr:pentatricopeptide repeat-containing protein At1g02150 [Tripterygium wilfordii]XP_038684146.1 pentatricopeptide repeat-containing protein At1g02150 [Tripterygium wilfordii]XP_038684147.1 pentatricopeptide repeat-containing protein At1g02150 [Tripterygium wilfordii]XP_038684148.1 pentatricopeptide repeat-containing protein At1g02150 [Tripterygium wilfordii]XP_038684150.1 pentatricopeptide repeat-containing protein At1g02150 [Tripterygium wilfordii]XP_038684151.1 pentatricopeptide repeat-conta
MLLQPSLHHHTKVSLSSTQAYSIIPRFNRPKTLSFRKSQVTVTCSISQIHSYGTMDYERRPAIKWNAVYKRISLMEKPELGAASVLNQWEKEGQMLSKWELCRVVKELRKYKRHEHALEVYEWMNNRGERFRFSSSDAAIQLDLIAKVHGVSSAEDFFTRLHDSLKDKRIYGALLNAYVRATIREKAESLFDDMRSKGYATHHLPFNVMMTLYMNLKEHDKVESIVSEMMQKNIQLDTYSYNIWLSSCGSQGSAERMEHVFEQMKQDRTINPNWTTFSTMATVYIKLGQLDKALDCLKKVESRITGRDRIPYHYLLSLYGSVGNKDEIYRVWNIYKTIFLSVPNMGYHGMISSLIRVGDAEGAEKIYEEWLAVKSAFDPRIANLLMSWHVKDGNLDRAESIFNEMLEMGGKPNSITWEILAEGHTGERRISEALSCWKEAYAAVGSNKWKAKPASIAAFFKLCEDEADMESKEALVELMRQSHVGSFDGALIGNKVSIVNGETDNDNDEIENEEVLLNQGQGSI